VTGEERKSEREGGIGGFKAHRDSEGGDRREHREKRD
jgi:hypothetical protein